MGANGRKVGLNPLRLELVTSTKIVCYTIILQAIRTIHPYHTVIRHDNDLPDYCISYVFTVYTIQPYYTKYDSG